MRIAVLATALSSAVVGLALADPAAAAIRASTSIAPQELSSALRVLAADRRLQILYTTETVANRQTAGAVGEFTVEEALTRLLGGTGLAFRYIDENTIMIDKDAKPAQRHKMVELEEVVVGAIPEILVKGSTLLNMDIRRSPDGSQPYIVFDAARIERSAATTVEDFRRRNLTALDVGVSQSQTVGGGGTSNLSLRGLGSGQTLILIDGRRTTSINLTGTTGQPDINRIPVSSIERIEVLASTAAGIYGGGATGGVINIVLKRNYNQTVLTLTREGTFEGGAEGNRVDLQIGKSFAGGKTGVTLAASFSDKHALRVGDRDLQERARAHLIANNPDAVYGSLATPPLGGTTNIHSAPVFDANCFCMLPGGPLTLKPEYGGAALGQAFTSVPVGYTGVTSDNGAGLVDRAGSYNLDLANTAQAGAARQSLVNAPIVKAATATVRHELSSRLQAFVELGTSSNHGRFYNNGVSGVFNLAAGAPGNPFNEAVVVTTPVLGGDQTTAIELENHRAVGGLILALPNEWSVSTDFTWEKLRYSSMTSSSSLLLQAAADVESGGIDLFSDTSAAGVDFSPYLLSPITGGPTHTESKSAVVRAAGPLPLSLPAGRITLATSFEHRDESLDTFRDTQFSPGPGLLEQQRFVTTVGGRQRTVDSLYAELSLPLIDSAQDVPGIQRLELQAAARWDRYRTLSGSIDNPFFPQPQSMTRNTSSSVDPLVSLRLQPLEDLTFRASYGTGFQPPSLGDLTPSMSTELPPDVLAFFGVVDPLRGNEPLGASGVPFVYRSGGNPDLAPEQSESVSAGVILTPRSVPGLRVSLDWLRLRKSDNIGFATFSQIYLDAGLEGLFVRGAPRNDGYAAGPIVAFDGRPINFSHYEVEALDFAGEYRLPSASLGELTFTASATRNLHSRQQLVATLPVEEFAGVNAVAKLRINASVDWQRGPWGAGWTSRYTSPYWLNSAHAVVPSQGSAKIGSELFHDLWLQYSIASTSGLAFLADSRIQLSVRNVFNERPRLDLSNFAAVYSHSGDPRMASYQLAFTKAF
jgi:iron complex outermembrane recepter protein